MLYSPGNGDNLEVCRPLLFWQASSRARHYEIFIDNKFVARIKAARVPVISYAVQRPLTPGTHNWFVKATGPDKEIDSTNFVFTVEPSTPWPSWAIGPFVKYGGNPILRPAEAKWESWNVYNPGVIFDSERFRMLYRGQENVTVENHNRTLSRIGYAESSDGVTFHCRNLPVIDATEPFESKYGCEDARLVKYRGVYYTFYTGNLNRQSRTICLCEAISRDCIHWQKLGIIETGTKNGAIVRGPTGVPVKIKGKFVMYTGDSSLGVCYSDDLKHWGRINWIDPRFPRGWVAPYEPCVAIANYSRNQPNNIVLFIAGTLNGKGKWFYAISELLFSKSNLMEKKDQLGGASFFL